MTGFVSRRAMLLGTAALALASCAPAGVGPREIEVADRPSEGGIGGTGIIGILNDPATLSINGLDLAAAPDLEVRDVFGQRQLADLAAGQALNVEAYSDADGRLVARSIGVTYPLIGPIDAVTDSGFRVLGVEVEVEPGAPIMGSDGIEFVPVPGQQVAVSGVWRADDVVATRVDLLDTTTTPVVIAGEVKPGQTPDSVRLGTVELALAADTPLPRVGSFVTAIGERQGDVFGVERLEPGRFAGSVAPLTRLSVEGYLEPTTVAPGYAIAGLGHSFDDEAVLDALASSRALYIGPYDGDFRVALGLRLPEGFDARRALLASLNDGFAPGAGIPTR
ncbi:MAG: DUF5666 domain-containing protein [Pseudomonadota bacterium]